MFHKTKVIRRALFMTIAFASLASSAYAAETVVDQKSLKFVPDTVTINAGDTVRFTNSDRFFHDVTVVNPDGTTEDKGLRNYKEEIVVTFAKPGNYKVRCRLHPAMTVAVTVK